MTDFNKELDRKDADGPKQEGTNPLNLTLEITQTYGSPCCNSMTSEHHPNCPALRVQPTAAQAEAEVKRVYRDVVWDTQRFKVWSRTANGLIEPIGIGGETDWRITIEQDKQNRRDQMWLDAYSRLPKATQEVAQPVEEPEKCPCDFSCMLCEKCPKCEGCEHVDKHVWPAPKQDAVPEDVEDDLLPCPFCGGTDLTLENLSGDDDFSVECDTCQLAQHANWTRDEAIRRWNTRSTSPARTYEDKQNG